MDVYAAVTAFSVDRTEFANVGIMYCKLPKNKGEIPQK
jgi:hypothetical protein